MRERRLRPDSTEAAPEGSGGLPAAALGSGLPPRAPAAAASRASLVKKAPRSAAPA
jgi:hypothetical protein